MFSFDDSVIFIIQYRDPQLEMVCINKVRSGNYNLNITRDSSYNREYVTRFGTCFMV